MREYILTLGEFFKEEKQGLKSVIDSIPDSIEDKTILINFLNEKISGIDKTHIENDNFKELLFKYINHYNGNFNHNELWLNTINVLFSPYLLNLTQEDFNMYIEITQQILLSYTGVFVSRFDIIKQIKSNVNNFYDGKRFIRIKIDCTESYDGFEEIRSFYINDFIDEKSITDEYISTCLNEIMSDIDYSFDEFFNCFEDESGTRTIDYLDFKIIESI